MISIVGCQPAIPNSEPTEREREKKLVPKQEKLGTMATQFS